MGRLAFPLAGLTLLAAVAGVAGTAHLSHRAEARGVRPERTRVVDPVRRTKAASPHAPEVRLLLYHLRFGSNLKRREVALALASLGPFARSAIPELVEFLSHDDDWWGRVRSEIESALADIMGSDDPVAVAAAAHAHCKISGDPSKAAEVLRTALANSDPGGTVHPALRVLAAMDLDGVRPAIPELVRALDAPGFHQRGLAAMVLSRFGEDARRAVREQARDLESPETRLVLGRVKLPEVEPPAEPDLATLRRRLEDPEYLNKSWILGQLARHGETAAPAIPEVIPLIDDEDLRPNAANVLAAIGPAAYRAVPALEPYVEDPWWRGRVAVVTALWKITGEARYRDLAFDPDKVKAGDLWAFPLLVERLPRKDAIRALGRLGPDARPAIPELTRIAADESADEYARDAARAARPKIEPR